MDTSLHCTDPRILLKTIMRRNNLTVFVMGLQLGCSPTDVQNYLDDAAPAYLEDKVIEWLED